MNAQNVLYSVASASHAAGNQMVSLWCDSAWTDETHKNREALFKQLCSIMFFLLACVLYEIEAGGLQMGSLVI